MPSKAHEIGFRTLGPLTVVLCFMQVHVLQGADNLDALNQQTLAQEILDTTGIQGGLIVHIGCGSGELTAALRVNQRYQVHGLDRTAANVDQARAHIQSLGLYGDVAVQQLRGNRLPYVDNLVNLIVAEDLSGVAMEEVVRVLVPQGVAYVKNGDRWSKTIKPRPEEIDEWTHYMYDASGNAVAHDSVVGPPRHLQWIGSPKWSRHHDRMASMSALVSSGGRIFYIMDEGSRVSIQLPPKWTLVARDAFNGTVLWKQPIKTWHNHLWPLKSGPTQLARRLVAIDQRVYVTLGLAAPLTALDAASGEILRVYEGSQATEELIYRDGLLLLLVNQGESELSKYGPQQNVGDQRRVAGEFRWNEKPRQIMAVEADSGRVLWSKETRVAPLTLAADRQRVLYHDGEKIVCLDRASGETIWNSPPAARRPLFTMNFGPKLVLYQDVVLFAGGDRTMRAFSAKTGKSMWTAPHAKSGYQSPEDLLVVGGLVWSAPTTSTRDSGVYTGRDPLTGEVKSEFPPDVETYWFHHRCYMAKATDRFLLPSRTGIEFVDYQNRDWDIHHWVRGGCLYGIMPCNGMVYAPPHDCACYPEAKLFGLNALAPDSPTRRVATQVHEEGRIERGPAYHEPLDDASASQTDWPTYRHDATRSGFTRQTVPHQLKPSWQVRLGGKLSSVVVAHGKLFVANVDGHTVHALDAETGKTLWSYTAEGRVDSPPTIDRGRVLFGSADGWVYCLRASDGELRWRFRAAPQDQRLMAFEQLESVWPVHGSVLVQDDVAYFVAGRSNFLDGGLRFYRLDATTGRKLSESILDDRDPETGANLQARVKILNMPVGLPDILSSDGQHVYMRSQRFDLQGNRQDLGPHAGEPAVQGSVQGGEGVHLFSPTGFLDGTWFHRSYWVYGRSFAGGHGGYYQAGKFAPAGRIMVFDDESVYGFGRKPEYYKWTTTLEHQLFAASKEAPPAQNVVSRRGGSMIRFEKSESLKPVGKPLAVEAWVKAERPDGVVLARGGPSRGYALAIRGGQPRFFVRVNDAVSTVSAKQKVVGQWVHLVGVLSNDKKLLLYVNGKLSASAACSGLIESDPAQSLEIGADEGGAVGNYQSPLAFTGVIDQVKIYHGSVSAAEIEAAYATPGGAAVKDATVVLACSFDKGDAADESGNKNHGKVENAQVTEGKFGRAMRFTGRATRGGGSLVKHRWTRDLPLFVQAMVLADKTLFLAGPPDLIDEEESFQRIVSRDPRIGARLAEQDAALNGQQGGLLQVVSAGDGAVLAQYDLPSLPVWDGMAAAGGRLYLATHDGQVLCLAAK